MSEYRARIADEILKRRLQTTGAVVIEGPKWCGKTTTAEQFAKSVLYVDDPEKKDVNIAMSNLNPKLLLNGDSPRLLDEWQIAPKLWDAVRFAVDHQEGVGRFILTGSSTPVDSNARSHSGTGRFTWLTMRPMSLFESEDSTGEVSLGDLFEEDKDVSGISSIGIERLAFLTCRGGWPSCLSLEGDLALDPAINYFEGVVRSDIDKADGKPKNEVTVRRLMRSFARHQGCQAPNATLSRDIRTNEEGATNEETVATYLRALRKIFVVEDMEAWSPCLRSKTAIRTSATRFYGDPSIATSALGVGPNDLLNDLNTFGLLFETLCVRDLRVYAEALQGKVYHYRDSLGHECDAIIHLRNGKYGLIEMKLGGDPAIEYGAKTLKDMAQRIDTAVMNSPSFLMVLVGVGTYAYKRPDGVYVVPIGCLRN